MRHTSDQLIATINEVHEVHTNAVRQRREMEREIANIETHLETTLAAQAKEVDYNLYR